MPKVSETGIFESSSMVSRAASASSSTITALELAGNGMVILERIMLVSKITLFLYVV